MFEKFVNIENITPTYLFGIKWEAMMTTNNKSLITPQASWLIL